MVDEVAMASEPTIKQKHEGLKGSVTLLFYQGLPIKTIFEGEIFGKDIDMGIRALIRGYRVWKAEQAKKGAMIGGKGEKEEQKSKEEIVVKRKVGRPRKIKNKEK